MVTDLVRGAEISQALGQVPSGLSLGEGDTGLVTTANTDAKVTVYSMLDGEPRPILRIDAQRVLSKRLTNGQPAFWMPGMAGAAPEYKRGKVMCYMHPDFDEKDGPAEADRAWLDDIGLQGRTCNMADPSKPNKADFRSIYDRDSHMRAKHKDEWRIIEAAKERRQRAIEAEERRLDREAMRGMAQAALAGQAVRRPGRPPRAVAPVVEPTAPEME